jgi:3-methyl-2-oxobutanoate hydroxymethyltransferase
MSTEPRAPDTPPTDRRPVTLPKLAEMKRTGEPIVMVTAYDFPSAQVAEEAGVDIVLVGDSAANVVLGYSSTVSVTMDEMVMLAAAVRRGAHTPLLVGDLPFGSYQSSDAQAVESAVRYVKEAGCDAVKIEIAGIPGGLADKRESVARARAIVSAGIPLMGHVGLTPQSASALGGFKAQGRTAREAVQVADDALALQEAGCFAIVFEAIPHSVTETVMERMEVPVIGIGAGGATDGQVLVFHDLLGIYSGHAARFVKRYANVRDQMIEGVRAFAEDVRARRYPEPEHGYTIAPDELERLHELLGEGTGEPFTGGHSL